MKKRTGRFIFLISVVFLFYSFFVAYPSAPEKVAKRPWKVTQYVTKYRYLAVELNSQTNIPVPIILGVAGLESNWGSSELAKMANNHFGIKAFNWEGTTHCKNTVEYFNGTPQELMDCFRKYPLIRESYQDFANFLKSRDHYNYLFEQQPEDIYSWAYGLQFGNYATDPGYAEKLIRLIQDYQLEAY